ncbi:hypothetical protein OE88DRAFT_1736278 [Heliocybe sulcata]|uniref:Uncharacterized protein n=1 Tax=Heliocybe sulcata TaxID=5364 RepID=A0A5C3MXQ9_9AGAM|nr:hypothetical protein OE88DRAFT_1736278 [Heliocybe sulcata]
MVSLRRRASYLSLKLGDPAPRSSSVGDRVVGVIPAVDDKLWHPHPVEDTPLYRPSSKTEEKPSVCPELDGQRKFEGTTQAPSMGLDDRNMTTVTNRQVLGSASTPSPIEATSDNTSEEPASRSKLPSPAPTPCTILSQTSWATHSPSTLQFLYMSIKSRCQLGAMSSTEMSALISIFGSIAVRLSRDAASAGDFDHPLASGVHSGDARDYWAFLGVVAQDKQELGGLLSDSDRYWIMRASLVELQDLHLVVDEAKKNARQTKAIALARLHYDHISRYSRSPDTHAAYMDAVLRYGDENAVNHALHTFLRCLRELDSVMSDYRDVLWKAVLRDGSKLSPALQTQILAAVVERIQSRASAPGKSAGHSLRKTSADHLSVSDLLSAMLNVIFSTHPSSDVAPVTEEIVEWCRAEVLGNLCPDGTAESLCRSWRNLSLLAFSDASPHLFKLLNDEASASPLPDMADSSGKTNWEIICALHTLEKAYAVDSSVLEDVGSILGALWDQWAGRTAYASTPVLVVRAIYACFMRLTCLVKEVPLRESLYCSYVSSGLWAEAGSSPDPIFIEYLASVILSGSKSWDEALAGLPSVALSERVLTATVNAALSQLVQIDAENAYSLYHDALRVGFHLESETVVSVGQGLAKRGMISAALALLNQSSLPPSDARIVIDGVLLELAHKGVPRLPHLDARMLGQTMVKSYQSSSIQLPFPPRRYVEFALLLLIRQDQAREAYTVFESVRRSVPHYFSHRFLKLFLGALLQHCQPRLATQLYLQISKSNIKLGSALRPLILSGLYRNKAHSLAVEVSEASGDPVATLPPHVSLMQKIKFGRLPATIASLKAASTVRKQKEVGFDEAKLFLNLLIRARRMQAAWKWFRETRDRHSPDQRAVLGNIMLHGELVGRRCRNARQVNRLVLALNKLVREHGFMADRVTVNILVKAILGWRRAISTQHVQALFDTLSESGYPTGGHGPRMGTVFGSQPSMFPAGNLLPKVATPISFRRHVQPLYKMFIRAFYLREDKRSAKTVVEMLKKVEREWHEQLQARKEARRRGAKRKLEKIKNAAGSVDGRHNTDGSFSHDCERVTGFGFDRLACTLTFATMSSAFPVVVILVIVLGLMAAAWFTTPKGPNQTLIRTSVLLTLSCCYLMWMITYMAQVHPLIVPTKNFAVEE